MCIIMLGGEDTHPCSATKVGNPIPATIPVTKKNNQHTTQTSHYGVITTQARRDCEKIAITGLEPASQDRSS